MEAVQGRCCLSLGPEHRSATNSELTKLLQGKALRQLWAEEDTEPGETAQGSEMWKPGGYHGGPPAASPSLSAAVGIIPTRLSQRDANQH